MADTLRKCCCNDLNYCVDPSHILVNMNALMSTSDYDFNEGVFVEIDQALNNFSMTLTRRAGIDYDHFLGDPCYEGQIFSSSENAIYLVNLTNASLSLRKYMAGASSSILLFEGDLPPNWTGSYLTLSNDKGLGNPDARLNIEMKPGDIGIRAYEDGSLHNAEFKTTENTTPDNLLQSTNGNNAEFYTYEIFFVADRNVTSDWSNFASSTPPENFQQGYVFRETTDNRLLYYDVYSQKWFHYTDCPLDTEWGPLELIGPSTTGYWEELRGDATGFSINYTAECEGAQPETNKVTTLSQVAF